MTAKDEENPPVLSIGVVYGGTREVDQYWKPELSRLRQQIISARDGVDSPLCVNVVYHVDGKLVPNEFKGVRTGSFSRKAMHLMVQAAVPPGPVDGRRSELVRLLNEAVDAAEAFVSRRSIADGLPAIRSVLESLPKG